MNKQLRKSIKKIITGDKVIVIAGKDKGKTGEVSKVLADGKVIVAGINIVRRHTKPNPATGAAGGIFEKEAALDISNIAVLNPETNKADRVGFIMQEGKKVRAYKSTKTAIANTK